MQTENNNMDTVVEQAPTEVSPVKKAKAKKGLLPIEEYMDKIEEEGENEEGTGKIKQILHLWTKGYTRKDIIGVGFNKSTVYRQTGEFEKLKKAPAITYMGFEVYEARVQKLMKAKKVSREDAIAIITEKDLA